MIEKKKVLFDTILSFGATMVLQIVIQFVIYPFFAKLDGEIYDELIYLMTFVNIIGSMGSCISLERTKLSAEKNTYNGNFLRMSAIFFLPVIPIALIFLYVGNIDLSIAETICFILLCLFSMLRNYGDVDFRISLNYKKYFLYFLSIAAGNLLGLAIWGKSGNWINVILLGEVFSTIFVILFGNVINKKPFSTSSDANHDMLLALPVVASGIINNIIFNMDRITLKLADCGENALSVFYIAGLFGKTMSLISLPLNNVAIGYLAKHKGKFTVKLLWKITTVAVAFGVFATVACTVASYIILPFLYKGNEAAITAKDYFLIANISSIIYFITSFFSVILLRYGKERLHFYTNLIYAVAFFALCVPACFCWGLMGLCISLIAVNVIKFVATLLLCINALRKYNLSAETETETEIKTETDADTKERRGETNG